VNNALSFDIEDWFQVENLREACPIDSWDRQPLRVEVGTDIILSSLEAAGARATFFILGWIAERRPELVRRIAAAGHEIASHGYGHQLVYDMTPESFRADLRRSKTLLEDICGARVLGYRAPSFSITRGSMWAIDVLREEGFAYDSSVFPVSVHDRYGMEEFGTKPFSWPNGLLEIPLAVAEIGKRKWPVAGGGYFRLLPYWVLRPLLKRINRGGQAFTFYLHPWELDSGQPRVQVAPWLGFRHYVNLRRTQPKLSQLLADFRFDSMRNVFAISA
jgi:polysaccharide deacetylase family protein (PEP-CTERM system associated)